MTRRSTGKPAEKKAATPVVEIDSKAAVGKYGEIFCLQDKNGNNPVSGQSYYIFIEQSHGKVTLVHPFSPYTVKFSLEVPVLLDTKVPNDWNPTPQKMVSLLEKKVQLIKDLKKDIPGYLPILISHFRKLAESSTE